MLTYTERNSYNLDQPLKYENTITFQVNMYHILTSIIKDYQIKLQFAIIYYDNLSGSLPNEVIRTLLNN